ncbi:hypothetical protein K438DRAFT_2002700 [Mycena galopus ATCC 62051]|nr:hypothetical protein K438DRAFT_2002700 [Mycena galopus ATCC 62051]
MASMALTRITAGITHTITRPICLRAHQDKAKLAWFKQLRVLQKFEMELKQLVTILEPIKCLEGLEGTVGDVWKFYVAITAVIRDLFAEDSLSFPQLLKD